MYCITPQNKNRLQWGVEEANGGLLPRESIGLVLDFNWQHNVILLFVPVIYGATFISVPNIMTNTVMFAG